MLFVKIFISNKNIFIEYLLPNYFYYKHIIMEGNETRIVYEALDTVVKENSYQNKITALFNF